jgi:toxin ParE1/3/4
MKRLRVSKLAERDLDRIWRYVATRAGSIEAANGVTDSIAQRFPMLARQPTAGRSREDIEPGLRSFRIGERNTMQESKSEVVQLLFPNNPDLDWQRLMVVYVCDPALSSYPCCAISGHRISDW